MPHQRELHCICSGEFQNLFFCNFIRCKKFPRITSKTIISVYHFCSLRFSKTAGMGEGNTAGFCINSSVIQKSVFFNQELSLTHAGNLHINVSFVFTREFNCSELEQFFFDSLLLLGKNSFWGEAPWAP